MKRITALILLILILALSATSCGSGESIAEVTIVDNSVTETAAAESTQADPFAGLPENDYEGYEFRMQTRNFERWIKDVYVDSETGEIVDDAIYRRNQVISEKFNIVFKHSVSSNDNLDYDAKNSILAGEDAYDIIVNHPRAAFVYANEMLLLDWEKDLPYLNLDNPWWDSDARESLSINHKLFVMYGDISYQTLGASNVMLFNKALFKNYGIDAPYKQVIDGTWTFDAFEKIVKQGASDLDGDGVMNTDKDQYGYVTQYWVGPIEALYVAGQRVLSKDENDLPYISLNNETTIKTFEWYFGLIDGEDCYCQTTGNSWDGGFISVFSEGRSMFIDVNMADVPTMREMDADFGIIPWPKLNESAEYCTNVDAGTNTYIVPITNVHNELTSIIMEAMAAIGYYDVVPTYYKIALQTKFSRDEDSADMLDIIKAARVFDLGYYNSQMTGTLGNHFAALAGGTNRDFASWYAQNEPKTISLIEKYVAAYLD